MGGGTTGPGLLEIRLLGPVEFRVADVAVAVPPGARRVLLAALALQPGRVVPVSVLIQAIWGTSDDADRHKNLHAHVYQLRKLLDQAWPHRAGTILVTREPGYVLAVSADDTDLGQFRALTDRGRKLAHAGDAAGAARVLAQALALWRGPALADVADVSDDLAGQATVLEEQRLAVLEDRIQADLEAGQHAIIIAELVGLTAAHPLRERLAGQQMLALYRAGRQGDALAAYRRSRAVLADELGIEPGPELRDLQQRILAADPALARPDPDAAVTSVTGGSDEQRPDPQRTLGRQHVPRQLPPASRHFTGRRAELKQLTAVLDAARPGGTVLITAVGGTGGIGKTTLALHWAHQHADRFPDGQLHVNLRGYDPAAEPMTTSEAIGTLLDGLGVLTPPPGLDAQAALYRTLTADRQLLIVLDNARDTAQARPLLPATPRSHVLVTSRNNLQGLAAAEGATQIPVGALTTAEAEDLLRARLGPERLAAEPGPVGQLIEHCAGLPLALSIIAARAAARPDDPLAGLAGAMAAEADRLDALDTGDDATSLRTVISWSERQLSAGAARTLRLLAIHPGPDITIPATASLIAGTPRDARRYLTELTAASLLGEHTPGRYAFHDLVRAYAAEQAAATETPDEYQAAVRRVFDHYLHSVHSSPGLGARWKLRLASAGPEPGVTPEQLSDRRTAGEWLTAEASVIGRCTGLAATAQRPDSRAWQLAVTTMRCLHHSARLDDAIALGLVAIDAADRAGDQAGVGWAHRERAGVLFTRAGGSADPAIVTRDTRLLAEAAAHLTVAVQNLAAAGNDVGLAFTLLLRGDVHYCLGGDAMVAHADATEALRLLTAAGSRYGQAMATEYQGTWTFFAGHSADGISLITRAAEMYEAIDEPDAAIAYLDLGELHLEEGRSGEAIACFRKALALWEQTGDTFDAIAALCFIARVHERNGDIAAAAVCWRDGMDRLGGGWHYVADEMQDGLNRYAALGHRAT
jgi:DNA-binding SARP family transcriptional activator/tetratricopeptide (TPR) repeat protein